MTLQYQYGALYLVHDPEEEEDDTNVTDWVVLAGTPAVPDLAGSNLLQSQGALFSYPGNSGTMKIQLEAALEAATPPTNGTFICLIQKTVYSE